MAETKQVVDSAQSSEVTEQKDSGNESELKSLLNEWDNRVSKSFEAPPEDKETVLRDPDEIAEFESRISSLETDNTALETEKSELAERVEQVEGALDFVEDNLTRIDQRDADRAVETLSSELGISKRVVELELKEKLRDDPDFAAIADARADSPDEFESAMERFSDELFDKHPARVDDRGVAAAVRIARNAHGDSLSAGEAHNDVDWPSLNDHEFAVKSEEVFADMRSGKLRPSSRRGGAGCLTTYPPGAFDGS